MRLTPKSLTRWRTCSLCGLSRTRRTVVLGRGPIPADVFFVGIGPGVGEDVIGEPFIGPSGRLMNHAIGLASKKAGWTPRVYFDNLVACRPTDDLHGDNRDPRDDEMLACRARLVKSVEVVRPQKIVLLGGAVRVEAKKLFPDAEELSHPASVLYSGGKFHDAIKTVAYRRFWMAMWAIFDRARKEAGE